MSKIQLTPLNEELNAIVEIPGSKSYTNRALLIASLANGQSILKNPLYSDDTNYMLQSLEKLGVKFEKSEKQIIVNGCGGKFNIQNNELFCGLAGTTSRFLTGLAAILGQEIIVTGEGKLLERPIGELVNALRQIGVEIEYLGKENSIPIKVNGQNINGNEITIRGDVTSQYISSLLIISPFIKNGLTINISTDLVVESSYIDMTIDIMEKFGVEVTHKNHKQYIIKPSQEYKPQAYTIEGDWSSASYFCCIGALNLGQIQIKNLNNNSVQGDRFFPKLMEKVGAKVIYNEDGVTIKSNGIIKAINIDMDLMPDTATSMAVLLSFAKGVSKITGIGMLKIKETNRLLAAKNELYKIGISSIIGDDYIIVHGGEHKASEEIETYNDHRIAMSWAIAGTKIHNVIIKNPEVVKKSFSNFWEILRNIGIEINEI